MRPINKKILVVVIFALLIRLVFIFTYELAGSSKDSSIYSHSDERCYHDIALSLKTKGEFAWKDERTAFWPSGYPFFLSGLLIIFGDYNVLAVRLIQAVLSTLTIIMLVLLARRYLKIKRILALGLLLSIYPFPIFYIRFMLTETLFCFLLVLSIYGALYCLEKPTVINLISAGLIAGAAILCRPSMIFLVPVIVIYVFLKLNRNNRFKAAIYLIALLLLPGIWSVRNTVLFGRFTFIATQGGYNLALGLSNEYMKGIGVENPSGFLNFFDTKEKIESEYPNEAEADKQYFAVAREFAFKNPSMAFFAFCKKYLHFWSPHIRGHGKVKQIASFIFFSPTLMLGLPGLLICIMKRQETIGWLFLALFISFSAFHAVFISNIRHRVAAIDLFLVCFAFVLIESLFKHTKT